MMETRQGMIVRVPAGEEGVLRECWEGAESFAFVHRDLSGRLMKPELLVLHLQGIFWARGLILY